MPNNSICLTLSSYYKKALLFHCPYQTIQEDRKFQINTNKSLKSCGLAVSELKCMAVGKNCSC